MKIINFFLVKMYVKRQDLKKIVHCAFDGLDTKPEPEPEPEPELVKSRNRNRNMSKVGAVLTEYNSTVHTRKTLTIFDDFSRN
jgi:hypothetical protein